MTLKRLPACFLLLLTLRSPTNASPLPPSPSPSPSLSTLNTVSPPPNHPQDLLFNFVASKIDPFLFLSRRDADADEYGVPVTHPSGTRTVVEDVAAATETAVDSPFQSSSTESNSSSNSKPLSPGVIAAIAAVVSVLFALALFALYRSQQRKNRRRDLSRTQEIEAARNAAAAAGRATRATTRTSSRGGGGGGGSLKLSEQVEEEGPKKVERAGSCSSQGTMVEVDVGLGERVVVQELGRKKSGGSS